MAVVQSGVCGLDSSTTAVVNVGTDTEGGTVEGSTSVCNGDNNGVLTLTGFYGSVVDWEMSTDDGATWTSLGNTDSVQTYSNLTVNTQYRAIVEVCVPDTSTIGIITMLPVCEIIISNLITMNGDGYNDRWFISNIDNYPESEVSIYNRYGKEVFTTKGYLNDTNDWDGTYKGKELPDGTYYYILKKDGSSDPIKGTITIVKN
jgi:gliding motility-associated-like protein